MSTPMISVTSFLIKQSLSNKYSVNLCGASCADGILALCLEEFTLSVSHVKHIVSSLMPVATPGFAGVCCSWTFPAGSLKFLPEMFNPESSYSRFR